MTLIQTHHEPIEIHPSRLQPGDVFVEHSTWGKVRVIRNRPTDEQVADAEKAVQRIDAASAPHDFETEGRQDQRTNTPCAVCGGSRSSHR
jgi:hypothetical protein